MFALLARYSGTHRGLASMTVHFCAAVQVRGFSDARFLGLMIAAVIVGSLTSSVGGLDWSLEFNGCFNETADVALVNEAFLL